MNLGDRAHLARCLRLLATGRITNFEFDDLASSRSCDVGVEVIRREAWYLYSDLRAYRLRGEDALSREGRREVARWIVFLGTDLAYEWPDARGIWRWVLLPLNVASLGLAGAAMRWYFARHGDYEVWPFIRNEDFLDAVQSWPRLA